MKREMSVSGKKEKILAAILFIAAAAAVIEACVLYVSMWNAKEAASSQPAVAVLPPPSLATVVIPPGWKTFSSSAFGFSISYPPDWQKSNDPLTSVNPHVFFGNPLSGLTTYRLNLFVYDNPHGLSAADYVASMLADEKAQDQASGAASGTAPSVTPRFSKGFALTVDGMPAYELSGVFEFDHEGEQVYVQNGAHIIVFDFPVADANPNIAAAAANNAMAREIVGTLRVVK